MLGKLLIEVEYVSVRVAFPQNRHEAKNIGLHSEAFTVGLNHALRGQLRRAVQRGLHRKWTSLWSWENIRLSVDRPRRGKDDTLAVLFAHRFQHVPGGDRILIQVLPRMFRAEANVGIRGKVNH